MDTRPEPERTIMVRHYTLEPGGSQTFFDWWNAHIPPLREQAGFTIEWAYLDRTNDTFTWALSYPGDSGAFREAENAYIADPARVNAMAVAPSLRALTYGFPERVY